MEEQSFFTSVSQTISSNILFELFLWLVVIGIVVFAVLKILRFVLHKIFEIPLSLEKKVLQIRVPKESAKKEEEEKSSKKDYKELIAVAESLYSGLGHIKPKFRPLAFFIGREDHFALEIVATNDLLNFLPLCPDIFSSFSNSSFTRSIRRRRLRRLKTIIYFVQMV